MRSVEFAPGTSITLAQAQEILAFIQQSDPTASLYADYSGREMYGNTCVGFVVGEKMRNTVIPAFITVLMGHASGPEGILESAKAWEEDNMARDYIVYFPYLPVEG